MFWFTILSTLPYMYYEWFTKLLDEPEEYAKMAHAANPYGDGHAMEMVVQFLPTMMNGLI